MIAGRPDRVQIWASQLAANDFPPVCAMTGRPAETWRKFTFMTPPPWTYALLILFCVGGLGIILYAVVIRLISPRAAGHLPLTRAARNRLNLYLGAVVALLPLSFVLFFVGLAVGSNSDSTSSTVAGILVIAGLVFFIAFLVGALARSYVGPRGKVAEPALGQVDTIVELRGVHPAFVVAVQQQQAGRLAQHSAST